MRHCGTTTENDYDGCDFTSTRPNSRPGGTRTWLERPRRSSSPHTLMQSRTLLYTPELTITARRLNLEVELHVDRLSSEIESGLNPGYDPEFDDQTECRTELVIIDLADGLKTNGLQQLRDFFDRSDLGVILIGMPGFDRQLARYPQLHSRIGFAHQYKPLDPEDIPAVLAHYWQQLGLPDTDVGSGLPAGQGEGEAAAGQHGHCDQRLG